MRSKKCFLTPPQDRHFFSCVCVVHRTVRASHSRQVVSPRETGILFSVRKVNQKEWSSWYDAVDPGTS